MIQSSIKTRVVGIGLSLDVTTFAVVDIRGNIIVKSEFPTTDFTNPNEFAFNQDQQFAFEAIMYFIPP